MTKILGIDLGTTHCALSYIDLDLSEGEEIAQHVLSVPQVVTPGSIESLPLLPSFLYLPAEGEPEGEAAGGGSSPESETTPTGEAGGEAEE